MKRSTDIKYSIAAVSVVLSVIVAGFLLIA